MTAVPLHRSISVKGRFHRSVSVQKDWQGGFDLSEYIATPAACAIADQVFSELKQPRGARAWSVTGPYGTGKSAFVLFMVDCLCRKKPSHDTSQALRARYFPKVKPLQPVLMQAERSPLAPILIRAVDEQLKGVVGRRGQKWRRAVEMATRSDQAIADLLVEGASVAADAGLGGLFVVIDELGKFLEYAASQPSDGDVFILQQLAEAAARSSVPIVLMTVLHSGFADYVSHGTDVRRAEWQKVQGRFRDIAFQLPPDQMLGLVAHALENKLPEPIAQAYAQVIDGFLGRLGSVAALADRQSRRLLQKCVPLHPLAALLLWPLFRSKVAQNERSLFAFLTSHEPFGLQEFLERSSASPDALPLLSLDDLYDYVCASLGLATFSGTDSRRWALIDHALNRVPASYPPLARQIVKAVGLLELYGGPVGLAASEQTLRVAVSDSPRFDATLESLVRDSIVIFRRHRNSFGLWEGSDLDLEGLFQQARARISRERLGDRLGRLVDLRPFVAKAHYIRTGTLRYFLPCLSDVSADGIARSVEDSAVADGVVLFLTAQDVDAAGRGAEISKQVAAGGRPVIVSVPQLDGEVASIIDELECWKWVREHVPAIEADPVAKQEVVSRLDLARLRFERVLGPIFGFSGFPLDPSRSTWFLNGERLQPGSPRNFQETLSSVCDSVYRKSPQLRNELLNRQTLSSAAAKARRLLIEAMLLRGREAQLGITGFPPEFSMYLSFLREGGFHREPGSEVPFGPPSKKHWRPAWDAAIAFLATPEAPRRSVMQLIELLRQPPYGLRNGPIPVLLTAALLFLGPEVALYEDGLFVPQINVEALERMLRRPETFEVQSYALSELERRVLREIARVESGHARAAHQRGDVQLVTIVRDLVRIAAELPPYTRQTKRGLREVTRHVRDLLLQARDPRRLLFQDLPIALNVDLSSKVGPASFAGALKTVIVELSRAYPTLLEEIGEALRTAFGGGKGEAAVPASIRNQSVRLRRLLTDEGARAVANEAIREANDDWRERFGRACNQGKPVRFWADEDVALFQGRLHSIATEYGRAEEIAAAQGGDESRPVLSIALVDDGGGLLRAVVPLSKANGRISLDLQQKVVQLLAREGANSREDQLATLSRLLWSLAESTESTSGDAKA